MKKTLRYLFLTIFTISLSYSQVVINELMYNPSYSGGTSDDGEYVELFNAGQSAVDLSGYKLSDAIDFTFPSGATIAAGSYLVVGRDSVRFKEDNGFDPHFDWGGNSVGGNLSNSTETVKLLDGSDATVDEVTYDDGLGGDDNGPSLELKYFAKDNASAESSSGNWGESSGKGSPNAINTNFNGTVWKSTLATDDKPIRTIPAGTWTQDAKPVINSLADFPKDTTYWQYWANTGGENAANETEGGHFEHQGSSGKDSSYANVSYSNFLNTFNCLSDA